MLQSGVHNQLVLLPPKLTNYAVLFLRSASGSKFSQARIIRSSFISTTTLTIALLHLAPWLMLQFSTHSLPGSCPSQGVYLCMVSFGPLLYIVLLDKQVQEAILHPSAESRKNRSI